MKKEKKLDIVFMLDKSGSMGGQEENTIGSFNEYLEKEKKNNYKTYITTVLFSDNYSILHDRIEASKVRKITEKDYYVGGCTALYDALGNTIQSLKEKDTDKVLFIIITDGYENASIKYKKEDIKRLIKKNNNYEFIYIGADIDSYATGNNIGIRSTNIANFKKDKTGTSKMFKAIGCFEESMMEDIKLSTQWKRELDEYMKENII